MEQVAESIYVQHAESCQPLPLRQSRPDEPSRLWNCTLCGELLEGVLIGSADASELKKVRPAFYDFECEEEPLPAALLRIVGRSSDRSIEQHERRLSARHAFVQHSTAVPLDLQMHPAGDPIPVLIRDISTSGAAIFHRLAADFDYVALELQQPDSSPIQIVMRVLRQEAASVGYFLAGPFVTPSIRTDSQ